MGAGCCQGQQAFLVPSLRLPFWQYPCRWEYLSWVWELRPPTEASTANNGEANPEFDRVLHSLFKPRSLGATLGFGYCKKARQILSQ